MQALPAFDRRGFADCHSRGYRGRGPLVRGRHQSRAPGVTPSTGCSMARKVYVLGGAGAGLIVVAARTGSGVSLFAVDGDSAGVDVTPLPVMDLTRRLLIDSVRQCWRHPDRQRGRGLGHAVASVRSRYWSRWPASRWGAQPLCWSPPSIISRCDNSSVGPSDHFRRSSTAARTCSLNWSRPGLPLHTPAPQLPRSQTTPGRCLDRQNLLLDRRTTTLRPKASRCTAVSGSPGNIPRTCTSSVPSRRRCCSVRQRRIASGSLA